MLHKNGGFALWDWSPHGLSIHNHLCSRVDREKPHGAIPGFSPPAQTSEAAHWPPQQGMHSPKSWTAGNPPASGPPPESPSENRTRMQHCFSFTELKYFSSAFIIKPISVSISFHTNVLIMFVISSEGKDPNQDQVHRDLSWSCHCSSMQSLVKDWWLTHLWITSSTWSFVVSIFSGNPAFNMASFVSPQWIIEALADTRTRTTECAMLLMSRETQSVRNPT